MNKIEFSNNSLIVLHSVLDEQVHETAIIKVKNGFTDIVFYGYNEDCSEEIESSSFIEAIITLRLIDHVYIVTGLSIKDLTYVVASAEAHIKECNYNTLVSPNKTFNISSKDAFCTRYELVDSK